MSAPSPAPAAGVIRSMTGYARTRRQAPSGEIVVSVKSLNHRGLDIHIHTSLDLTVENDMRTAVKSRLNRGHVEIRVSMTFASVAGSGNGLNSQLFDAYIASFAEASRRVGSAAAFDVNSALRAPGMLSQSGDRLLTPEDERAVVAALVEALDALAQFREREGAQLAALIRHHNARVADAAERIEALRARAVEFYQARLQDRLSELLKGSSIEPQRLAQEAAMLADRSDVSEEIARLKIHSAQLAQLTDAGGETGKRLDFLLQEMNRETNTILSKTNGAGEVGLTITELAISAKADIEKIREQALNLE